MTIPTVTSFVTVACTIHVQAPELAVGEAIPVPVAVLKKEKIHVHVQMQTIAVLQIAVLQIAAVAIVAIAVMIVTAEIVEDWNQLKFYAFVASFVAKNKTAEFYRAVYIRPKGFRIFFYISIGQTYEN